MRGIPNWFRANIMTARHGGWNYQINCRNSYAEPGYHLGLHWYEQFLDPDDEKLVQDKLHELLDRRDCAPAEMWPVLKEHFRRFWDMVPPKRKNKFAQGFIEGVRKVEGLW